jgi:hypothetical protein
VHAPQADRTAARRARRFVEDMRAYFAESNTIKADGIAARQLHALREHQGPRERKLRLTDVKEMFLQMRGSSLELRLSTQ